MNSKCLENSRSKDITERKQDKNELLDLLNSIDEKIKAIDIKHSNIENDLDRIEGIVKHNSEVIKTIDRPYSRKKRNDSESRAPSSIANKDDQFEQIKSLERIDPSKNKSRQVKYIGSAGFRLTTKIGHRKIPSSNVLSFMST